MTVRIELSIIQITNINKNWKLPLLIQILTFNPIPAYTHICLYIYIYQGICTYQSKENKQKHFLYFDEWHICLCVHNSLNHFNSMDRILSTYKYHKRSTYLFNINHFHRNNWIISLSQVIQVIRKSENLVFSFLKRSKITLNLFSFWTKTKSKQKKKKWQKISSINWWWLHQWWFCVRLKIHQYGHGIMITQKWHAI